MKICSPINDKFEARPIIATIGVPDEIKERINNEAGMYKDYIEFKDYDSIEQMEEYVKDKAYGKEDNKLICFGISFKQDGHKYDYSLHYFDSIFSQGVQDVPYMGDSIFDQFTTGPNLDSYRKYQKSGYTYILKLINEYILQQETDDSNAKLDFAMVALPYENYRSDPFSSVIGYFIPFFMVIAYMCPLCLYVYRMVGEKENKSKEGMKIMGLSEGTYFLSYFLQYIVISFIDSVINIFFMSLLFSRVPFILLFVILFLWALDIFGLIFFFQSFIDKTRVALILSLLIYFVMFFISMACMDEDANKALKIVLSIFPPVNLELGIILIGKFESHFKEFHMEDYTKTYTNYSMFIMNLMQIIDVLFYLFLGYYLQNVLPHDFGIKRPLYFICTKEYWCSSKKTSNNEIKKEINVALESEENDLKSEQVKINKGRNIHERTNVPSEDIISKKLKTKKDKTTNDNEGSKSKEDENISNKMSDLRNYANEHGAKAKTNATTAWKDAQALQSNTKYASYTQNNDGSWSFGDKTVSDKKVQKEIQKASSKNFNNKMPKVENKNTIDFASAVQKLGNSATSIAGIFMQSKAIDQMSRNTKRNIQPYQMDARTRMIMERNQRYRRHSAAYV